MLSSLGPALEAAAAKIVFQVGHEHRGDAMFKAATMVGLGALFRQRTLVYTSIVQVLEAEDDADWQRVQRCVEETRAHILEGVRLFEEHLARAPNEEERQRVRSLADEFLATKESYGRVLDAVLIRAQHGRAGRAAE